MGMATVPTPHVTRRFTSDEVWRMVEIGLLGPDEPYELIDGELVYVSPQGPTHFRAIGDLTAHLSHAYGLNYRVMVQGPVSGIVDSIPEPDLTVVSESDVSGERHVTPSETLLMIEVSDSSLRRDIRKGEIYAMAGAAEYWRVDLRERVVYVHRGPLSDGTWATVATARRGDELPLPGIDATLAVATFLPPG